MLNKVKTIDMLLWVSLPTLALAAISRCTDYGLIRFLTATGISITETLCIVVFVESIRERRKKKK